VLRNRLDLSIRLVTHGLRVLLYNFATL